MGEVPLDCTRRAGCLPIVLSKVRLYGVSVKGLLRTSCSPKEAWSFYRTISGVRLCWELEEPKGPKGPRMY